MRTPISGGQFGRDVKLAHKRGKDTAKLREVILRLIEGKALPARYRITRWAANGTITAATG